MHTFLLNVLLTIAWAASVGEFSTSSLFVGFVLGFIVLWLLRPVSSSTAYFRKTGQLVSFAIYFVRELVVANLEVAWAVLSPNDRMRPAVIAVPLDVSGDTQIALLSILLALTPGTLTLDVSDDKRVLYVHAMSAEDTDACRRRIKDGFERRILELFR